MCEDLGSTFDFDFNDLVFDVQYTREEKKVDGNWVPKSDGKWDATITLQAVGGTLPIYIENFNGTVHNAHELMGGTLSESGIYSPVNVGTSATHDPVTLDMVRVTSTNPDDIVIRVTSPDKEDRGASKVTTMILPRTLLLKRSVCQLMYAGQKSISRLSGLILTLQSGYRSRTVQLVLITQATGQEQTLTKQNSINDLTSYTNAKSGPDITSGPLFVFALATPSHPGLHWQR